MTTATRSCLVYRVTVADYCIGEADDRDEAETVRDAHANRNRRPIADYHITVELREEAI